MIITLIGSARFEPWFKTWNEALSFAGHCVFSLAVYPSDKPGKTWYTKRQKQILDEVHKAKISASNAVVLLNVFAYIGESTLSEISYARAAGKPIYPLGSWGKGLGYSDMHYDSIHIAARRFDVEGCVSPIDTTTRSMCEQANFSDLLGLAGPNRSALIALIREVDRVHGGSHE